MLSPCDEIRRRAFHRAHLRMFLPVGPKPIAPLVAALVGMKARRPIYHVA